MELVEEDSWHTNLRLNRTIGRSASSRRTQPATLSSHALACSRFPLTPNRPNRVRREWLPPSINHVLSPRSPVPPSLVASTSGVGLPAWGWGRGLWVSRRNLRDLSRSERIDKPLGSLGYLGSVRHGEGEASQAMRIRPKSGSNATLAGATLGVASLLRRVEGWGVGVGGTDRGRFNASTASS